MAVDIIAEVGSNWHTKQDIVDSIELAAMSGATIVKFQLFRADTLYSSQRAPELYKRMQPFEISTEWLPEMREMADARNVKLWMSVFDLPLARNAADYCHGLKIASGDITYFKLIKCVMELCKRNDLIMSISTGAATYGEICAVQELLYQVPNSVLFHCRSVYPANPKSMNLYQMITLYSDKLTWGLSDHTTDSTTAVLALALGFKYFEKHFKIDGIANTPDADTSLNIREFNRYVGDIRNAEAILGEGQHKVSSGEIAERIMARRGPDDLRPNIDAQIGFV